MDPPSDLAVRSVVLPRRVSVKRDLLIDAALCNAVWSLEESPKA
jgi:hypothetical protein